MKFNLPTLVAGLLTGLAAFAGNAAAGTKLDDAAILAIFDQANAADIWTARLGIKYGHSNEVRELAGMVAADHETVQHLGRELARKLEIVPAPPANDASAANLAKAIALLQTKSGPEFDRAYLRHEIAFHQSVIDAIKGTLLPVARNEELKALILKVLPGFEHHLAATRAAAKKLGVH